MRSKEFVLVLEQLDQRVEDLYWRIGLLEADNLKLESKIRKLTEELYGDGK